MSAALSSAHVLGDRDRLRLVDHHGFREGAGAQAMHDRLAGAVVERRLAVERKHFLAEDRRALGAGGAEPAIADERRHHMVAHFKAGDARADGFDHARRLVTVDGRQFPAPSAVDVKNVAVADRAGGRADQNLARPRLGEFDRLHGQGRAEGAADSGFRFHGNNPAEWRDLGGCGSIPRLGQEFKRSLVARGNNFCGAGRGGWVSWAAARAFGRGPIFSRRWMRFCVTRRGARAPLVSHRGRATKSRLGLHQAAAADALSSIAPAERDGEGADEQAASSPRPSGLASRFVAARPPSRGERRKGRFPIGGPAGPSRQSEPGASEAGAPSARLFPNPLASALRTRYGMSLG